MRRCLWMVRGVPAVLACAGLAASVTGQPTRFQVLSAGGNQFAFPRSISADGSVVAGDFSSRFGVSTAGRWVFPGGMVQSIGTFMGQGTSVDVLTRDGLTVFGGSGAGPFRWTSPGPSVADPVGRTLDISPDGAVRIVSNRRQVGSGALEDLGVPTGYESASLRAIDGSGEVVVGDGVLVDSGGGYRARGFMEFREAARWTLAGGWQTLGFLPGDGFSQVFSVSDDGLIVVGTSRAEQGSTPRTFRLVIPGVMEDLGTLPGSEGFGVEPRGMSSDGGVIVGTIDSSPARHFVWTVKDGMRDLEGLLRSSGQDLDTLRLLSLEDVSADGAQVIGLCATRDGAVLPFIAPIFSTCSSPESLVADGYEVAVEVGQVLVSEPGMPSVASLPTFDVGVGNGGHWLMRPGLSNQALNARGVVFGGVFGAEPLALARIDGAAAGTGGDGTYVDFFQMVMREGGRTALFGKYGPRPTLQNPVSGPVALWSGVGGVLSEVVRVGGTLLNQTVSEIRGPIFQSNGGRTAFVAFFDGSFSFVAADAGSSAGYFISAATRAPFPADASFINPRLLAFSDSERIALSETISHPTISDSADTCIMVRSVGDTVDQIRVREGSAAPGQPAGVLIGDVLDIGQLSMNDAGRIAFRAPLSNGERAVFAEFAAGLTTLAAEETQAPGMAPGTVVHSVSFPAINNEGKVVFTARVRDAGGMLEDVLYVSEGGAAPSVVFRAAGDAPGLSVCSGLIGLGSSVFINGRGQVLFTARVLAGGGVVERDVLYVHDPDRGLVLVGGAGQVLPLASGARTIEMVSSVASLGLSASTTDGKLMVLSDDGDVLFRAVFSDQSEAYVRAWVTPSAPAACAGDADDDGVVTFADITSVLNFWLVDYSPGSGPGDASLDGVVNFADITAVLNAFGVVCP